MALLFFRIPRSARIEAFYGPVIIDPHGFEMVDNGRQHEEEDEARPQRHAQPFPIAPERL